MARKKILKGQNAEYVEKRIADVPEDLGTGNIFKVLKNAEKIERTRTSLKNEQTAKSLPPKKEEQNSTKKGKDNIFFNRKEKEMIKTSCKFFRNSLPVYLRSVQADLKVIDAIVKKLK